MPRKTIEEIAKLTKDELAAAKQRYEDKLQALRADVNARYDARVAELVAAGVNESVANSYVGHDMHESVRLQRDEIEDKYYNYTFFWNHDQATDSTQANYRAKIKQLNDRVSREYSKYEDEVKFAHPEFNQAEAKAYLGRLNPNVEKAKRERDKFKYEYSGERRAWYQEELLTYGTLELYKLKVRSTLNMLEEMYENEEISLGELQRRFPREILW